MYDMQPGTSCCSSVLCLRNIWDLLPLLYSPYTLTYIHFFGRGYFVQNNLSVHHTKWCVQQTSDRHPYQWEEDNKKLCVFCLVLSSVQFISDLVSSEWCSFSYPCFLSSMQPIVVTSCFGFLWGFACFFMFLYVSYMTIFSVFEIHWSKDFLFSAKSVKIAVIEPGLALAEKGHQVTVVCPIKAKKEVGYGKSLGGFLWTTFLWGR